MRVMEVHQRTRVETVMMLGQSARNAQETGRLVEHHHTVISVNDWQRFSRGGGVKKILHTACILHNDLRIKAKKLAVALGAAGRWTVRQKPEGEYSGTSGISE